MAKLTPAETDDNLDFIAGIQKSVRMIKLCLEIVVAYLAGKLNFLDLDDLLLLFGFFFTLVALKSEFTVVHYAAYRRCSLRRNHNEVEFFLYGKLLCFRYRHYAYLLPVRSYKAHFGYFYFLIDEMFLLAYSKHLQKIKLKNAESQALRINSDNIGKSAVKIGIIPRANGIGAVRTESSASFCLSSIPQALLHVNTFAKIHEKNFPAGSAAGKVLLGKRLILFRRVCRPHRRDRERYMRAH